MPNPFNVQTVSLEGSKLVEASAGTGKTYSIAVLVLRLVLEREIPLPKILMVTFTKAATAELEARIRKFVRQAYQHASGKEISDPVIRSVVGEPGPAKREILRQAVQSLDSLSVMTIHGFCQKCIDEFTFETNQPFDYEILTDDTDLLGDAALRFFREELNVLEPETFREIWKEVGKVEMEKMLRKHLARMRFIDTQLTGHEIPEDIQKNHEKAIDDLREFVMQQENEILLTPSKYNNLKVLAEKGEWEGFINLFRDQLQKKKPAGYFDHFDFMKDGFMEHDRAIRQAGKEAIHYHYIRLFKAASGHIQKIRNRKGYITYDDQIRIIHRALGNGTFRSGLAGQYEAVFIDEFQDTDRYQYEIFSRVFEGHASLFYIGDPKQSIYGWRGADLDTYKQARNSVGDSVFTMSRNYRSTGRMIEALNILMGTAPGNMFLDDQIHYIPVTSGASDTGEITAGETPVCPVTIWRFDANDHATNYRAVAQEVFSLLTGDTRINGRPVKPGDIGILVRDNREGEDIRRELATFNIPAIKRDDARVMESPEATLIQYLIEAVIAPRRGTINRVLLSAPTGLDSISVRGLDDDFHISQFLKLRKILTGEGIYNMISAFLSEYGIRSRCAGQVSGQRILTNLQQIAEILHRVEKKSRLTPPELLVWMQRNAGSQSEEYEQRIESDSDAVQISTIHKAKGLEYHIVFAPCLSMIPKRKLLDKGNVNDFRKDGEYCFTIDYPGLTNGDRELFDVQKEQENRRLVYVALTRAVYKCFISLVPRQYYSQPVPSSLSDILEREFRHPGLIRVQDMTGDNFERTGGEYQPGGEKPVFRPREAPELTFSPAIRVHSFSALSNSHHSVTLEATDPDARSPYDRFIFHNLGRGASVGTALHAIFERLTFDRPDTWEQTILESSKYYPNILKAENLGHFHDMVQHVMGVTIQSGDQAFSLGNISDSRKLPELEFCYSLKPAGKQAIHGILDGEGELTGEAGIEGMMTGFIDLLFEHQGRYYILDWKSNHLGNALSNYDINAVGEAMRLNNYNLQYMIYTIAVKRWLSQRVPDFDYHRHFGGVIYLFLRGIRQGSTTGIFTALPEYRKILELEKLLL